MFNDSIAEFLTKVRNAVNAKHRFVDVRTTKMLLEIVKILKEKGFVENTLVDEESHKMRIFLKYTQKREPIIHGLRRMSTPGMRKYMGYRKIPSVFSGIGVAILSTPKGVIDDASARNFKVGGELLCYVW